MAESMWALQFSAFGNPAEVITKVTVPKPVPGPGEVLVRLEARPVNPSDTLLIRGFYNPNLALPAIAGFEGTGVVEAVGEGAATAVGTHVAFWVSSKCPGSWAEFCVIGDADALEVPADLPKELAAQVVLNPLTVMGIISELGDVKAGEWLLQTGGFSACGKYLVQHLKPKGIKTISVVRQPGQVQLLKELGADEVICLGNGEKVPERVLAITEGQGVKYAVDCVWGAQVNDLVAALAFRGTLINYGVLAGIEAPIGSMPLLFGLRSIKGFAVPMWTKDKSKAELQALVNEVVRELKSGAVKLPTESFGIEKFTEALQHSEVQGKPAKSLLVS